MALAVVLVIALTQVLTLVALDGPGCSTNHSSGQALTLVALDGPGCNASHSSDQSLDTSSSRWP